MATPRYFDLAFRAVLVLSGAALIIYALVAANARTVLWAPILFGFLLLVQGSTGT